MSKEDRRQYIFAQLGSLPNAMQYVEVTKYIEDLEQQCKQQKEVIDRIDKYIKPLITNRDDEQYYDINWYNKDVLLSMLKEASK